MNINNKFYVAKLGKSIELFAGYSWASGQYAPTSNLKLSSTPEIDVQGYARFIVDVDYVKSVSSIIYFLDKNQVIQSSKSVQGSKFDELIPNGTAYVAIEIEFIEEARAGSWDNLEYTRLKEVMPHYKSLKKQYKKENDQVFFRESLDGKINLWGQDYLLIKNASIEDELAFYIYHNDKLYSASIFNKTDCTFGHAKGSVELKLTPKDAYTKVLNAYRKTHDLLKLAVGKTAVQLTKRGIIQIYIQGENVISNYAGGTYWDDEVLEAVDNQEELRQKYFFTKGPKYAEVSLLGFNYDINSAYSCIAGQSIWNGTSYRVVNGIKYQIPCSIKFTKVYSSGTTGVTALCLSDGITKAYSEGNFNNESTNDDYDTKLKYDTYRIEIYTGQDGTGTKIYQSEQLYGNDSNFIPTNGEGLYKMVKVSQSTPNLNPEPESFYLGEKIIEYQLWGRLLCDVDVDTDGVEMYDLPYDDFATERANFRKCIGLEFVGEAYSIVHFKQSQETQEEPTPYGLTEYGKYFRAPAMPGSLAYRLYPYPLARSTWGNTSLWVAFEETSDASFGVEKFLKKHYKTIVHRDTMEIGAVIKALLAKIDPAIKFEPNFRHSNFLYGSVPDTIGSEARRIYITQKSNILKGEYDQAAQKAEITFEQLMNMLRDCFRCYWYIDDDNNFRLEHIRYFMNGLSYEAANLQYDLTQKLDKFNKKPVLFAQQDVTYAKGDLKSRYEFAWSDDVTEAMGGGFTVDVLSNYIEQDSVENVNVELFTSDLDYMMFAPNKFSSEGFALIITDSQNKVPVVYNELYDQKNTTSPMTLFTQNYYASFISLFNNYLFDMPAGRISSSIGKDYVVRGLKRCVSHKIAFRPGEDPSLYALIGTEVGQGHIEEMSIDIDTRTVNITLSYEPG